jgi:hypothetical protein
MTRDLRFCVLMLALLASPAVAETEPLPDAFGDCRLTGPVQAPSTSCLLFRVRYQQALAACLQDRRVKAASAARLGVGRDISAPAARARMVMCQAEIGDLTRMVE